MREVSWGTELRDFVQAVGVFCKLRAPPIKLSLHSWTLSNPLVSKIIPLSETCNNSLYTNFQSHKRWLGRIIIDPRSNSTGHPHLWCTDLIGKFREIDDNGELTELTIKVTNKFSLYLRLSWGKLIFQNGDLKTINFSQDISLDLLLWFMSKLKQNPTSTSSKASLVSFVTLRFASSKSCLKSSLSVGEKFSSLSKIKSSRRIFSILNFGATQCQWRRMQEAVIWNG